MATATLANKEVEVTEEGFLVNPDDWTEDIAKEIAKQEGIELTDRHWDVIRFMREDYKKNGTSATIRHITKHSDITTKELYQLFPKGPAKLAAKIAGVPKPVGCI
ncbi:MAG: TusE/DsrC/DsvC family sulfur relay protein [Candidatus Hydrogenedentota bacterium]|nr:MAG: TusE/DsrC/DsvC family sulfur relay protein [Candidatus Hydrogenedentota bacterium]